ncbi:MAG: glutamine-hydrolyzing GMP synthase [Gammaproteobacteria bacterium]|nr:glutamine-hydrolyzing GMP synthase [Gammaproteobacteria bacterium]
MTNIHEDRILILDFGSQYTQLIARRIRELGVYCELYPYDISSEDIKNFRPSGIILSGSHESVTEASTPRAADIVFELGVPVLGICYGMQTMAAQLGGAVITSDKKEFGYAEVHTQNNSPLFSELDKKLDVWMSHGDQVSTLPPDFVVLGSTENAPIVAMADEVRNFYGVQFHPEVTHTQCGKEVLSNFVHKICGCRHNWNSANIIQDAMTSIRAQVGNDHVILGLSGGVDSSVVAALLHQAIGAQLTCIFVDTGLLRLNEGDQVMKMFADHMKIHVIRINAEQRFLEKLVGVHDPEEKRKIIGKEFVAVFDEEAKKIKDAKWLAQGTIYPDVIESAGTKTGKAKVIKSHHNVGGLPEKMNLKLLEPLRELFKDEVRKMGVELGLPASMVYRHPFPGPGLAVRILEEVKKEYADILRHADAIFIEELYRANLYDKVSQAFAVFLPIKSVGVGGDNRRYEYVIALRAVETIDFMTAHWAHLPYDFLGSVSNRIINEVRYVSRVVYDISGKPPATIEWE